MAITGFRTLEISEFGQLAAAGGCLAFISDGVIKHKYSEAQPISI
jgi:hypothetical protein